MNLRYQSLKLHVGHAVMFSPPLQGDFASHVIVEIGGCVCLVKCSTYGHSLGQLAGTSFETVSPVDDATDSVL